VSRGPVQPLRSRELIPGKAEAFLAKAQGRRGRKAKKNDEDLYYDLGFVLQHKGDQSAATVE
jgi:hypothetical protein